MHNRRNLFIVLYAIGSSTLIFVFGSALRSGYQFVGDGELFVYRDGLLFFICVLCILYLSTLFICHHLIKLPLVDCASRIVLFNLAVYAFLGFVLLFLRIPLYSRTILISEVILSTLLLLLFFSIRNRYFPVVLAILSEEASSIVQNIRSVRWQEISTNDLNQTINCDGIVIDANLEAIPKLTTTLTLLSQQGMPVYDLHQTCESIAGRIMLKNLSIEELDKFSKVQFYGKSKRILDILFTLLFLPVCVFVGSIIAIIIAIDSPGKIFFRQQRIGYGGKSFRMYKFRSMHMNDNSEIAHFAKKNDDRITRFGKVLRKSRLDELPQFINVLKGEMSIIGPRPEQIEFVRHFEQRIPFYNFRHCVRPGISGWAQTMYGYASDENQTRLKLEYDFVYIKNFSLWIDVVIVIKTIMTLVFSRGAR